MRRRMGTVITVVAVLVAAGLIIPMAFSWGGGNAGSNPAKITAATVNGRRITELDFSREVAWAYYDRVRYGDVRPDTLEELRSSVMDNLIDRALILSAAKDAGFTVKKSDVEALVKSDRDLFASEDQWLEALARWGFTPELYATYLEEQTIVNQYPAVACGEPEVTEEEIVAEFERSQRAQPSLTLESARENIKKILSYRKQRELQASWLDGLRERGKISIVEPGVLAYRAMEDGKFEDAIKHYQRAIKQSPQDPYLQVGLGKALLASGRPDDSRSAFDKAIQLQPDDPFVMIAQGDAARESGDTGRAVESYKKASELAREDLSIHALLHDIFKEMGLEDEANAQADRMDEIREIMRERQEAQARAAEEAAKRAQEQAEAKAKAEAEAKEAAGSETNN
jgi:tetratricopeptide (TPR) repeat protein